MAQNSYLIFFSKNGNVRYKLDTFLAIYRTITTTDTKWADATKNAKSH